MTDILDLYLEPGPVFNQLYGIYDQSNNTILGTSLNISVLEKWLNTTDYADKSKYIITSVNDTMISLDKDKILPGNWTNIEYYMLVHLAGGSMLKIATGYTKSSIIMKIYKMYVELTALPFQLIIVLTIYIAQIVCKLVLRFTRNIVSNGPRVSGEEFDNV